MKHVCLTCKKILGESKGDGVSHGYCYFDGLGYLVESDLAHWWEIALYRVWKWWRGPMDLHAFFISLYCTAMLMSGIQ